MMREAGFSCLQHVVRGDGLPSIFDKIDDAGYFNAEAVSQRIEVALPKNEEKLDIDAIRKHIKSGTAEPINYSELEEDGWAIRSEARQGQSEGEAKYDLVRSSWNPNAYERYHERKRKLADRPQHIEAMKMQLPNEMALWYLMNKRTGKVIPYSARISKQRVNQ